MWQVIKSSPLAVLAAVLVHALLVVVLMVNIDWPTDEADSGKQEEMEVIEATAVDEKEFEAREQRLREAEEKKRQQAQAQRQAELKKQREAEEKKRREEAARKQREAEEKKRQQAEAQRQAELQKQREAEAEKRRKEEAARKQREAEAEKRRKAEEARKQREAEEEKRRKEAEARKQREAEQRREQERAEKALQAEMKAEAEAQARREWLARHGDEINRYKSRIKESITRQWRIPATARSGMRCKIMVRLLPGGDVASVRITQSSGDAAFDRSVEDAVYSAAPLPVPAVDSGLFDEFREIEFVFAPEDKR